MKPFLIDDIYVPMEKAFHEIRHRFGDVTLRKKVLEFAGSIPEIFGDGPKACIFRNIATPNYEIRQAKIIADRLGLQLVIVEYLSDVFCTRNIEKVHLGKLLFCKEFNRDKQVVIDSKRLFNLQTNDMRPLENIYINGISLAQYHHELFLELYPDVATFDISAWIKGKGNAPSDYYPYLLSLFGCHGILLETYFVNTNNDERRFVADVVMPAYNMLYQQLAIKPIIVSLFRRQDDESKVWQYYPVEVRDIIQSRQKLQ